MATFRDPLPLAPYADVEEQIAAESHIVRTQAVATGPRLSFPDFIEFHDRHRQYRIDSDRSRFCSFARGFCGPGNLTIVQWYQAWDAWLAVLEARDLRDTQDCALDVGVQQRRER